MPIQRIKQASDLSPRQTDVCVAIARLTKDHGCPPTIRELSAELGLRSTNSTAQHIRALRKKGAVEWRDGCSRTLRLTPMGLAV